MARNNRDDMHTGSYEEQMAKAQRKRADSLMNDMSSLEDQMYSMIDRQRDMILNFYKASTDAGRESIKTDMRSRQEAMREQLENMKKSYSYFSKQMTFAEKRNFKKLYNMRSKEFEGIERDIKSMTEAMDDGVEYIGESFRDSMSHFADELRDIGMALNLSSIAQDMQDDVDSYIENLRQLKARAQNFESKMFNNQVTSYAKETGILSRNAASEVASNFMLSMGIDDMKYANRYLKEIESLSAMGIDSSSVENIVWQDNNTASDGKYLRSVTNMAALLDDSKDLEVKSDGILSAINEKAGDLLGLAEGDEKQQKKLTKSVALIEALQQNAANNGMSDVADEVSEWFSYGTNLDFTNDDQFRAIAAATNRDISNGTDLLEDPEELAAMLREYRNQVESWDDAYLYSMVESGQTPFKTTASAKAFAAMSDADLQGAIDSSLKAINTGDESDGSVMTEDAHDTVGAVQEIKNQFSGNGIVAKISDTLEGMDLSLADLGGLITIGSTAIKAVGGIGKLVGKIPGIGSKIGNLFSGVAGKGGSVLSRIRGLFGGASNAASAAEGVGNLGSGFRGASSAASAAGGVGNLGSGFLGSAGSALSSAGSSMMAGTALETGGLALAGTAALGTAGAAMTVKDAIGGYKKSEEWLGDDGKLTSGKINSTIGGAIGGTGPGLGEEGSGWDKAKNIGGNTLKDAAIGGAIGSVIPGIGTAIGAAVGAGVGAITAAIGGDKIAKGLQTVWNGAKEAANEAFKIAGASVEAVNGVLQEMGPVGQTMGNILTESWGAVVDTKDKIAEVWADPNSSFLQKIGGTFTSVVEGVGSIAKSVVTNVKDLGKKAWDGIEKVATKTWDGIKKVATNVWNGIKDTAGAIWDGLQEGVKSLAEAGATLAEGIGTGVGNAAAGVGEGLGAAAEGFGTAVGEFTTGVGNFASGIGDFVSGVGDLASGIGNLANGIGTGAGNFLSGAGQGAGSVIDSITGGGISGMLEGAGKGIGNIFKGAGNLLFGSSNTESTFDMGKVKENLTGDPLFDRLDIMIAYLSSIDAQGGASGGDGEKKKSGGLVGTLVDGAKDLGEKAWSGVKTVGKAAANGGKAVGNFLDWINPFDKGLSYVPNDGLAMIHQGEAVLTKDQAETVRAQADGGIDILNTGASAKIMNLATTINSLVKTISEGMSTVNTFYEDDKKSNANFVKALNKSGLFGIKLNTLTTKGSLFTTMAEALVGSRSTMGGTVLGNIVKGVKNVLGGFLGRNSFGGGGSSGSSDGDNTIKPANTSGLTGNKKDFIDRIKPGAIKAYRQYHVLPSLTLAQGALESEWGKRAIGNNLFGIKAGSSWKGKRQRVWTHEVVNGKRIKVQADFRDYDSLDDSVVDHAKLLTKDRYANVLTAKNYKEAARAVAAAGYATDPSYASSLINLIESNGLNAWDNQYAKGTPWLPNDQVALVHEGEMIVPRDVNPLNNATDAIPLSGSGSGDDSETVETLKWMVYRLEAKFDKLIQATSMAGSRGNARRKVDQSDTDRIYSFV